MAANTKNDSKTPASLGEQISAPIKYDPKVDSQAGVGEAEVSKNMEKVKKELENFKKKVLKKFPFTVSLSVLPANSYKSFEEDEGLLPEEIARKPMHLMMIIPEEEFKNIPKKIKPEVVKLIIDSKQNLWVHIKTHVDVWNYGLDSKPEFIDAIGGSFPLHDNGFLGALRVATIHKSLVLRKFDKYVASYIIAGSLVRGTAGKDSDIDVSVIIDDTDVKRMPRLQLLERLRAMIYDYIREATALAGTENKLEPQIWLLTDFWERVKDAEPVAFTQIRDGVPMHDRGTFLPWKLLLHMGKIKPSPEAVDKFMKMGEQTEAILKRKMLDAMVDIYWGVVTPIQALFMLAGHSIPVPKDLVQETKRLFVEKEKIMGNRELKILEKTVKLYKDYEHGKLKDIPGKDIDLLFKESQEFDKKMKELRKKLESRLLDQNANSLFDEVFDLLKKSLGNKSKTELLKSFEDELVKKGKMKKKFVPILKDISEVKSKVKSNKISTTQFDRLRRDAVELIGDLIDYAQRKELMAIEKGVMRVQYADKAGELVLTDSGAYFIAAGKIAKVGKKGFEDADMNDFDQAIKSTKDRVNVVLDSNILKVLEKELGDFTLNV